MSVSDWHPALRVIADPPAGPLQILDVHLRGPFDGDHDVISNFFQKEADHVEEIALFTDGLLPHVPTVALGDFNEDPSGPAVRWPKTLASRMRFRCSVPGRRRGAAAPFSLHCGCRSITFSSRNR
jgi:endonuclease/exonuclease/phosphatase family metal-dependent hydrolase